MKPLALVALIPAFTTSIFAADLGKVVFEDDFNRKETQTATDAPGTGWGTNSKALGSLHSPGISHPTKRMLRFSVPRNAVVDDVKIYRKD